MDVEVGKGHVGYTVGEFDSSAVDWLKTTKLYNYRTERDYSTHVPTQSWRFT
jgi:hypothetical protein